MFWILIWSCEEEADLKLEDGDAVPPVEGPVTAEETVKKSTAP